MLNIALELLIFFFISVQFLILYISFCKGTTFLGYMQENGDFLVRLYERVIFTRPLTKAKQVAG